MLGYRVLALCVCVQKEEEKTDHGAYAVKSHRFRVLLVCIFRLALVCTVVFAMLFLITPEWWFYEEGMAVLASANK